MRGVVKLGEYLMEEKRYSGSVQRDLARILNSFRHAAKFIHRELSQSGIARFDSGGKLNVHGEVQHHMDEFANHQVLFALKTSHHVLGAASEEMPEFKVLHEGKRKGVEYIVLFDPLDGSTNIDCNVSVGTIFSIYKRVSTSNELTIEDFVQPGRAQLAAGYIVYGPSTTMVYTTGEGVHMFTLDPSVGVFCLSQSNLLIPSTGTYYSVNETNLTSFPESIQKYLEYCKDPDPEDNRPYQSRYVGSLVADFHRNLLKGGIFLYPPTLKHKQGKIRMMYECNPLAFIAEQAGGMATDGVEAILDKKVSQLHQRSPLYIGSSGMMKDLHRFIRIYGI